MASGNIKEPEDGIFTTIKNVFTIIFFPESALKGKLKDIKETSPIHIIFKYLNSIFRFLLLICVLPAIPFIIILILMLESLRYFFSKFIHL